MVVGSGSDSVGYGSGVIYDARLQRLELILVSYDARCASARIFPQPTIWDSQGI